MENTIKNPLEYRGGVNFQDSYTKIIGTFFHDSTSSGLIDNSISKRNKVSIALKTTETFDRSLAIMESGLYQNTGGSDLSALFIPFVATVNSNMNMPSVSGLDGDLDEINARTLLPFEFNASGINKFKDLNSLSASGDAVVGLVSANRYYDSPLNIRQVSDVRGIGLRLPLMGIGWGYNTNNEKIPAGSGANKFKGEVDYGWQVDPKDYIAAPIDLRYDEERNVWTIQGGGMERHQHLVNSAGDGGPAFASFFADDLAEATALGYLVKMPELEFLGQ